MLDQVRIVRLDEPHPLFPLFPFLALPRRGLGPTREDLHDRFIAPLARVHAADDEQLAMPPRAPHERGRPCDAQALELGEEGVEERGRGWRAGGVACDEEAREVVAVL